MAETSSDSTQSLNKQNAFSAFQQMHDLHVKLLKLNYEQEACKKYKIQPIHR